MEYKAKRNMKTAKKLFLVAVAIVLYVAMLSGCAELFSASELETRTIFYISDTLTQTQTRWILIGEAILILFLVLLVILLIVLFRRYRKTEKRALEASVRERALMKENEMLDSLNRTKTEFFHNMSHDFKTPLTVVSTSILNALDLLDYGMDKEEMKESLQLAQSEIMRMARIIDTSLKNAVLHENKQRYEEIDITLLMHRITDTYRVFVDRRGSTLSLSITGTLPTVYSNADILLNIFSNLISNANRYTRNGKITIYAETIKSKSEEKGEQEFVSITVSDTGTGIKPEFLPTVFKRGISESETGTGLGLHICKAAVEAHGGTVNAKSVYGAGTDITFTVPVYSDNNFQSTKGAP